MIGLPEMKQDPNVISANREYPSILIRLPRHIRPVTNAGEFNRHKDPDCHLISDIELEKMSVYLTPQSIKELALPWKQGLHCSITRKGGRPRHTEGTILRSGSRLLGSGGVLRPQRGYGLVTKGKVR